MVHDDAVAWCAAFVGACLARADQPNTGSLLARSYLDWGAPLTEPRLGAVAILSRGRDTSLGHVGFLVGMAGTQPLILAGNQGDAVSIAAFPPERLLGLRWPAGTSPPATPGPPSEPDQPPQSAAVFDAALTHVLAMEGGWSNDPVDPGGATNFGITIGEFAHETGVALSPDTQPQLTADLRHISPALVRSIYFKRYWQAAFCDRLPAGLALMHFDAAVNHGVGTAALLLQSALDVDPDGEIGPDTMLPISEKPDDLSIVVAGGPGSHSVFMPVSAYTRSVTREVVLSE